MDYLPSMCCGHAHEYPAGQCVCPINCACREGMCTITQVHSPRSAPRMPGHVAPQLLPWDTDVSATRAGLERLMRALICVGGHFTDSFAFGPMDPPSRISVFLRVFIPEGREEEFKTRAKAELLPPPRVHL